MDVIFHILTRFFTAVCNAYVQLLQIESTYLIAIEISHIELRNDNTDQTGYT
jgi:alcohol dehydrogenase YqhD (iron-dependent ADH family)